MAEPLSLIDNNIIVTQKPINHENPGCESTESPFRRIGFHLARKPFTGFSKGGGDMSFRLETLNPSSTSSNNTIGNRQSVGLDSVGGGSSGKKRDATELGNGLDPELSFGITVRRITFCCKGGGSGGSDGEKGAAVVAVMATTPDLPKIDTLTNKKALDDKTDNKATNLLKTESLTKMNGVDRKPKKKVKSFLKCKAMSMKFTANVFIGTSLNKRKKKKHKQSKKIKNLAKENTVNKGPCSSEKVKPQEVVKPPVENGLIERGNKNGAVLATNDLNGVSKAIQTNHSDRFQDNSKQKDLLHLLTRGLDDRIVPRWDEAESARPFHIRETKRDLTIGYIGDEWDEEYDRGKRKKVRISKT